MKDKIPPPGKKCDCDNPATIFMKGAKEWVCEVCFKRQELYARSNYCDTNIQRAKQERWQPEFGRIYE